MNNDAASNERFLWWERPEDGRCNTEDRKQKVVEVLSNKKLLQMFHGFRGSHGMGDLLEVALLSSMFYPRPYALGSRLKLFKRVPLAAGGKSDGKFWITGGMDD
jgi:hypothetical protein